jgi:hypothetical protein
MSCIGGGTVAGRHKGGIDDVLDTDSDAGKRAQRIDLACILQGRGQRQMLPCLNPRLGGVDPGDVSTALLLRRGFAGMHARDRVSRERHRLAHDRLPAKAGGCRCAQGRARSN